MDKSVLVTGGEACGIQAALDLGDKGFHAYMVEKEPSTGGRMAFLDKVFPTNDCSICILAPKMITCFNHANVDVLTCAEIEEVKVKVENFKVKVKKKARYVDENKYTGCDACIQACVLAGKISDEWNEHFGTGGAAYIPFMQAVPRVALIDPENCLQLSKGKCKKTCVEACRRGAIDFNMKDMVETLEAGSVIVATGLTMYDSSGITEYGYGKFDNVIHGMEYERLINASGPTGGHLKRHSDGERPKRIVYIQCVGARDIRSGRPCCCSVCCMYATKDAMLTYMHNDDTENFIFCTDLRAFGKGIDEYIKRDENEYAVKYIRSRPGEITEDPETKNLLVWYDDTESGEIKSLEADMVVLSVAFVPPPGIESLGKTVGVEMDEYNFFKAKDDLLAPVDTEVPGIYIAGACTRPADVTGTVTQGGGAADRAAQAIG